MKKYIKLDERKKIILEYIIRDYIETAEPVGSRAIVRKYALDVSAATVRNEMSDLEELGYLEQPHTSAGRVPSEKGLRYYVDCIMKVERMPEQAVGALRTQLELHMRDLDDVVKAVGQFISQITNYTSFVILPALQIRSLQWVQLVLVSPGTAMLLAVTDKSVILHHKFAIPEEVSASDLNLISASFNKILRGKALSELSRTDLEQLSSGFSRQDKLIDNLLQIIDYLIKDKADEDKIVVNGLLNMLKEPEFKDIEKLHHVLNLLKEADSIKNFIPEEVGEAVNIRIGRENASADVQELSLVFGGYKMIGQVGKIGLLGPVRMEYWKAAGAVETVRSIIEDMLDEYFS